MECISCGKEGFIEREGQALCKDCFQRQFEGRIKDILSEEKIERNNKVLAENQLIKHLLEKLLPFSINIDIEEDKSKEYDDKVLSWSLEDECINFLEIISSDKDGIDEEGIRLLKYVTEEDIKAYASMNDLDYTPREKDEDWSDFLESFDKTDMKRTLLYNIQELKNIN